MKNKPIETVTYSKQQPLNQNYTARLPKFTNAPNIKEINF